MSRGIIWQNSNTICIVMFPFVYETKNITYYCFCYLRMSLDLQKEWVLFHRVCPVALLFFFFFSMSPEYIRACFQYQTLSPYRLKICLWWRLLLQSGFTAVTIDVIGDPVSQWIVSICLFKLLKALLHCLSVYYPNIHVSAKIQLNTQRLFVEVWCLSLSHTIHRLQEATVTSRYLEIPLRDGDGSCGFLKRDIPPMSFHFACVAQL